LERTRAGRSNRWTCSTIQNRPPRFARWYSYPGRPPASASRCHASCSYPHPPRQRSCLGGCFPRAPHLSRAVLRPRCARARPAPVAPWSAMSNVLDTATRFPASRLRRSPDPRCRRPPPPLSHKLRSVADSANVFGEVGSLCASGSGSSSAQPWFAMSTLGPRFTRPSSAPAELSHLMRRGSPAQSLLAMTTVVARAMKTPARHTGCGKKEQPVRRSPMRNAALRRARFVVPLPPSPAAPTQTTPAKLSWSVLQAPALSRLPCGTCTAPSVGAGWLPGQPDARSGFRGVALGATSSSL